MMAKVFITRKIPSRAEDLLKRAGHQVRVYKKDQMITKKALLEGVRWCDALLCLLTDTIDQKLIDSNSSLQVISNYAVGYNNIDVAYASKKGLPVTNTPGVLTNAVAEHTIGLILALARRIVEADTFTRKGKYRGWEPGLFLGYELRGRTLGIIGSGRIGSRVAEIAKSGLGMNIIYTNKSKNHGFEKRFKARFMRKASLLKKADIVSLHVPLLPSTRHLIDKEDFKSMKSTALLINTARGPIINEKALLTALKKRAIAGAALDVFENEPKLTPGLNKLHNLVLTPHIASASIEARTTMAELAAKNIIQILRKRKPLYCVNPEVFER